MLATRDALLEEPRFQKRGLQERREQAYLLERIMKLYSGPLSMFGAKAEIALREKGRVFELEMVAFDRERGYHPKHPEVLRVNPKRQVPVLIDESVEIFDSTQIFEYLEDRWPEPPLWPRAPAERAKARALEHCSDEVFFPNVIRLMGLRADPDPTDAPEWIQSRTGIENYYAHTELAWRADPTSPVTTATPTLPSTWRSSSPPGTRCRSARNI